MNSAAADTQGMRRQSSALHIVAIALAWILQLAVGYFTVTAIGLVGIPVWGIAVLAAAWLGFAVVLSRTARRSPVLAPLAPIANALVLWGFVAAGGAWFGWTA